MASSKLVCPSCKAVLKPTKPVPDGMRLPCPRCKKTFVTPGAVKEVVIEELEAAPPKAAKKAGKKAPKKAEAAPARPAATEEEDDSAGIYGIAGEKEEEEDKPEVTYAPDLSIKDLRGPAQAAIVRPSNGLMVGAALGIALSLFMIAWNVWPFIFAEHVVDHEEIVRKYLNSKGDKKSQDRAKNPPKDRKDLSEDEMAAVDRATSREVKERSLFATLYFINVLWNAVIIFGAVKMQNLESYPWSMASCILGLFPITGFLVLYLVYNYEWYDPAFFCGAITLGYGIFGIIVLRDEPVIDGFYFVPE